MPFYSQQGANMVEALFRPSIGRAEDLVSFVGQRGQGGQRGQHGVVEGEDAIFLGLQDILEQAITQASENLLKLSGVFRDMDADRWLALLQSNTGLAALGLVGLLLLSYINLLGIITKPLRFLFRPVVWLLSALLWPFKAFAGLFSGGGKKKPAAVPPQTFKPPLDVEIELQDLSKPSFKKLYGRADVLAWLDESWDMETVNICEISGPEGGGKSAVVSQWLENFAARDLPGAKRVFGWSFPHVNRAHGLCRVSGKLSASEGADPQHPILPITADVFFEAALHWFGYDPARHGSINSVKDRGIQLSQLVRRSRTLLVLDGVDSFIDQDGQVLDASMKALFAGLAEFNSGLCLLVSRHSVGDLGPARYGPEYRTFQLKDLPPDAAKKWLVSLGVSGKEKAFQAAFKKFGTRPLGIELYGKYVRFWHRGAIEETRNIGKDATVPWGTLRGADKDGAQDPGLAPLLRVLAAHSKKLADKPELPLLYLLGLGDGRLSKEILLAMVSSSPQVAAKKQGVMSRLVDKVWSRPDPYTTLMTPLMELPSADWPHLVARLWAMGLLHPEEGGDGTDDTLEVSPLVRDYFAGLLKKRNEPVWRLAHGRMFRYLLVQSLPRGVDHADLLARLPGLAKVAGLPKERRGDALSAVLSGITVRGGKSGVALERKVLGTLAEIFPSSLDGLKPLFAAMEHAMQADEQAEALQSLYATRIRRGEADYLGQHLGAHDTNLFLLSRFFDAPWHLPSNRFTPEQRTALLQWAGASLRAMGRLKDADMALGADEKLFAKKRGFGETMRAALAQVGLRLAYGNLEEAKNKAQEVIDIATKRKAERYIFGGMIFKADALHQMGRVEAAEELLRKADEMQRTQEILTGPLAVLMRFVYADVLLAQGRATEVIERLKEARRWKAEKGKPGSEEPAPASDAEEGYIPGDHASMFTLSTVPEAAMDEMVLGEAFWVAHLLGHKMGDLDQARNFLTAAIGSFQTADSPYYKAKAYLSRAQFLVSQEEYITAADDIEAAYDIAEKYGFRLLRADCSLETARVLLANGDPDKQASHDIEAASSIVEDTGYRRRVPELERLYIDLTDADEDVFERS